MSSSEPVLAQSPLPDPRVRRTELLISQTLRAGVMLSLFLIVLGTCISYVRHPSYFSSPTALQQLTQSGATFPHTLPQLLAGLRELQGQSLVLLGLLVLLATPVLRVGISIVAFAQQRDAIFVIITTTVLLLLLLSFVLGHASE